MSGEKKEAPRVTAARRQWELKNKARNKIRVVGGRVETYEASPPARDLETVLAAANERERILNPQIGDRDERGVYLGIWAPKDKQGNSLGDIFNVYAAPEDLPGIKKYGDTVAQVAALKNWHGHDGANYANDEALHAALGKGDYKGGWFIPPLPLLTGMEPVMPAGRRTTPIGQPDNLFDHRDKGAFKDTFTTVAKVAADASIYYWSSTQNDSDPDNIWSGGMTEGNTYWNYRHVNHFSCRPVRLEPRRELQP